jgi:hypothetical protein
MKDLPLTIEVVQGDVLEFRSDVLALKYAQHYYGSDEAVSSLLIQRGVATRESLQPQSGSYVWVDSQGALPAPRVLFLGVPPLIQFRYSEIQDFTCRVLLQIAEDCPSAEHVAITLHGPGYGLDEVEALHAEVRGILGSVESGKAPANLARVSIVERNAARVTRLNAALAQLNLESLATSRLGRPSYGTKSHPAGRKLHPVTGHEPDRAPAPSPGISVPSPTAATDISLPPTSDPYPRALDQMSDLILARRSKDSTSYLQSAEQVELKPRAFVAMPFAPEMEDVFYYGIQNPVRQLGYVCERVDQEAFTGDVLAQVRSRIEAADIVIADLTGANPNVFLEVGYAWGKARPTVLVIKKAEQMRFDVQGQRCLQYQSIKDLETRLTNELKNLPPAKKP